MHPARHSHFSAINNTRNLKMKFHARQVAEVLTLAELLESTQLASNEQQTSNIEHQQYNNDGIAIENQAYAGCVGSVLSDD